MIEVVRPGSATTVQDLGRPGLAHLGVPPSGAFDVPALALANRLAGNPPGAPALETTLVGPVLRFHAPATVAAAGAPTTTLAPNAVRHVRAGEVVDVGTATEGVRTYLAVRGGLAVEPVLGSAATDALTGLGPAPLRAGDRLAIGAAAERWPAVDVAPVRPRPPVLRVVPGPRDDWFADLGDLLATAWAVGPGSNRIGVRLAGGRVRRAREGELPSEGVVTGALQVPPSGEPILLGPDHPTTGGYPVVAVVVRDDLPIAAQLRPGAEVRFRLG